MSAINRPSLGTLVTKGPSNLPQTATANLFAVTGVVEVTGLVGLVTTALGATVTTLAVGVTGSNTAIATAATVTSAVVNTVFLPVNNAGVGGAPLVSLAPFPTSVVQDRLNPFFCAAANITWTTSANDTGQMQWYLWYIPFTTGSSVS